MMIGVIEEGGVDVGRGGRIEGLEKRESGSVQSSLETMGRRKEGYT